MNIKQRGVTRRIQRTKNQLVRKFFGEAGPRHVCEVGVGYPALCHVSHWIGITRVTLVDANQYCCIACRRVFRDAADLQVHWTAIVEQEYAAATVGLRLPISDSAKVFSGGFIVGIQAPRLRLLGDKLDYGRIEVPATSFDRIDDGSIDYLSLDMEGSEYYVIATMQSRPRLVFIEMQSGAVYDNPKTDEILELMLKYGYRRLAGVNIDGTDWGWILE